MGDTPDCQAPGTTAQAKTDTVGREEQRWS
jgi:hypothetical protein